MKHQQDHQLQQSLRSAPFQHCVEEDFPRGLTPLVTPCLPALPLSSSSWHGDWTGTPPALLESKQQPRSHSRDPTTGVVETDERKHRGRFEVTPEQQQHPQPKPALRSTTSDSAKNDDCEPGGSQPSPWWNFLNRRDCRHHHHSRRSLVRRSSTNNPKTTSGRFWNQRTISDDGDGGVSGGNSSSNSTIHRTSRMERLRETVGDFGIALFAPLLDWDNDKAVPYHHHSLSWPAAENNKTNPLSQSHISPKIWSSSCATLQTEPESDHYRSEDDDHEEQSDEGDDDEMPPVRVAIESDSHLLACPRILSEQQMTALTRELPEAVRDNIWERCFAIGLHGDSFISLLQRCAGYRHTIVVIRTVAGDILGGYASEEWRSRDEITGRSRSAAYYGTGLSLVFANHPASTTTTTAAAISDHHNNDSADLSKCQDNVTTSATTTDLLHIYKWTGENDYCQICDSDKRVLCMGGAGDFGWIVSDDFTTCRTGPCQTFGNPPLVPVPNPSTTAFRIADFEIYNLASPAFFGSGRSYEAGAGGCFAENAPIYSC